MGDGPSSSLVPLAEVADFTNGYAFGPAEWGTSGLPIIRIQQLLNPAAEADSCDTAIGDRYLIDTGDLIMSWSGTIAVVRWDRGPAWLNQHLFRVDPKPGVDDAFLKHVLDFSLVGLESAAHGTTMKHIKRGDLLRHEVSLPPVEEQRQIAEILDTIDETIQATERVIAKLTVTASGLASAAVAAALAGPGVRSIGQIADGAPGSLVQTGPFGSQLHASDYVGEGVPTFMPTDIANGRLDGAGAAKITESKAVELARHRLRSGDVLFGRRGDLSRCAVVPGGAAGGLCGTGCLLVRIPNDVVAADWLALVYRHDYVQRQVLGRAVGSTMLNLSAGLIRSLLIPLPTEESERLMAAFRSSEQLREAESNRLSKLREIRRGLASDLLSGRVRTVAA